MKPEELLCKSLNWYEGNQILMEATLHIIFYLFDTKTKREKDGEWAEVSISISYKISKFFVRNSKKKKKIETNCDEKLSSRITYEKKLFK